MISAMFAAQGHANGAAAPTEDEVEAARVLLKDPATRDKLRLPDDVIIADAFSKDSASHRTAVADISGSGYILDIGPNSITSYANQITNAKRVIWNGPMGLFEWPAFSRGTRSIAKAIAGNDHAFKLAGGGSTVEAINAFGVSKGLSHISTGGGASLEFLEGKSLPGVVALCQS